MRTLAVVVAAAGLVVAISVVSFIMREIESLRLQMAMDRLSKLMSTLSNLLKKASEIAQGITQNIK